MLVCEMPEVYPPPSAFPDVSLKQLFNWPNVSFTIILDHVQIVHELRMNVDRDIVIGDNNRINLIDEENVMEMRYLESITSSKQNPTVHKDMLSTYISSMIEAARLNDVPPSKLGEIQASFSKMIEDVKSVPNDLIETKLTHSQFLNEHKYMRVFDNNDEPSRYKKVKLREIINPESTFRIDKSVMATEQVDVWSEAVATYFEDILIRRRIFDVKLLKERLKKCLTMKCVPCNLIFEGAMSTVSMKDHIKEKHYYDKPWECVKCRKSWSQFELTEMDWKHECLTEADIAIASTSAS